MLSSTWYDDAFTSFFDGAFRKETHLIVRAFFNKEHNEEIVHTLFYLMPITIIKRNMLLCVIAFEFVKQQILKYWS